MVSSYPVHTANKTDYQLVAKPTPNFTPKNVKLGVLFLSILAILWDTPKQIIEFDKTIF